MRYDAPPDRATLLARFARRAWNHAIDLMLAKDRLVAQGKDTGGIDRELAAASLAVDRAETDLRAALAGPGRPLAGHQGALAPPGG